MKLKALIVFFLMGSMSLTAQKSYQLQSPDKKLQAVVTVGDDIRFSFTHDGTEVLAASPISMTLQNGVLPPDGLPGLQGDVVGSYSLF